MYKNVIQTVKQSIANFGSYSAYIKSRVNSEASTVYEVAVAVYLFFAEESKEVEYKSERQAIQALVPASTNLRMVQYWLSALKFHSEVTPNFFSVTRWATVQPILKHLDTLNSSMIDTKNAKIAIDQYGSFKDAITETKDVLFDLCYKNEVGLEQYILATKSLFSLSNATKREERELKREEREEQALKTLANSDQYENLFHVQRNKEGEIDHVSFRDVIKVSDHMDLLRLFTSLKTTEQSAFIDKFCAMNDIAQKQNDEEVNDLRAKLVALKVEYKSLKMQYANFIGEEQMAQLQTKCDIIDANVQDEDFKEIVGFSIS